MLQLIRNKIISKVWLARIISVFGDIFFDIFVTWHIYSKFKDLKIIVYTLASSFLLKSLFAVISGKITDTLPRRKIIIFTDIASAFVISNFICFDEIGHKYIYLFIFLFILKNFLNSLFSNAFNAFLADNVKPCDFIKAQALISSSIRIINFFGATISGIMVAFLPIKWAVLVDALSFLFSAAIFYSLKNNTSIEKSFNQLPTIDLKKYLNITIFIRLWEFIKLNILSDKFVTVFCINVFFLNLIYGYIPNVFPYLLAKNSGYGAAYLGILRSIMAISEVLGLIIVSRYGNNVSKCFIYGLLGTAISLIVMIIPVLPLITIIMAYFLYGLSDSVTQPYYSYFVTRLPSLKRGRIIGFVDMIVLIAAPIGMFLGEKIFSYSIHLGIIVFVAIIGTVLIGFITGKQTKRIVTDVQ